MKSFALTVFVAFLFTSAAWGLTLDEAKQQGLVGETSAGYLAPVASEADSSVTALVNDINNKRRQAYAQIAQKNSSPLDAVERIAGREAIAKAPRGTFVRSDSGGWTKK
jgi:uncharacterized protein